MSTINHPRRDPLSVTRTLLLAVILPWAIFVGMLYAVSLYSYLFFHSLAELFSIVVGLAVFMLAWNTRRFMGNQFLVYVGLSYLFVGFLDLIHTLSYKGMGIFPGDDPNLPTQLWIAARYLQSLSFLAAVSLLRRQIDPRWVLFGLATVTALLMAAIASGLFPDCYIDGSGLTPFKKVSEYIISILLAIAVLWLRQKREDFHPKILGLIIASVLFTILSELSFTFYVSVYGLSNFVGHIFKIFAVYCIYKSVIETGLNQPFDLLFLDMKKREQELEKSQKLLHAIATHDPLTGLPNRLLFETRLTHALERAERNNYPVEKCLVQVIILDVDDFKNINDLLGHIGGDEVLKEIARRLKAETRESDTVSRWGGDEFTCVIEDILTVRDVEQVVQKILTSMSTPMLIQGHSMNVTVSLGVSLFPKHGKENEDLLRCADAALYRAKETKNSFRIYDASMQNPLLSTKDFSRVSP